MKFKLIFPFAMLITAIFSDLSAQSAIAELEKIRKAYATTENLSAQVELVVYKDKSDLKGALLGNGAFNKHGSLYYSKYNNEEMLVNNHGTLLIDHDEKHMMWFEPFTKSPNNKTNQFMPIDSLIEKGDSAVDNGIKNGYHQFTLYSQGIVEKTIVQTDVKTNFVIKLISYYRDKNANRHNEQSEQDQEEAGIYKTVVTYKNISTNVVDADLFSETKFVTVKNKKPFLTKNFSNYKITVVAEND